MERYSMCLGRRINIVKVTILPNAIYRFSAIPIKLPMAFFTELEQKISQFIWKRKRPPNSQNSLEKEEWGQRKSGILTSDYTTKLKSSRQYGTGTKTEVQSNGTDRKPRNKPMHLWVPFFDKGGKNIQGDKDSLFNKWCWENWTATCKRMKLELS